MAVGVTENINWKWKIFIVWCTLSLNQIKAEMIFKDIHFLWYSETGIWEGFQLVAILSY